MNTSRLRGETTVWDATALRYFALVERLEILADAGGGIIRVPREVWDPNEDPSLPDQLISEIGRTIRFFSRQSHDPDAQEVWTRLIGLASRKDLSVIDMDDDELVVASGLRSLRGPSPALGPGESSVIAIAEGRRWSAGIDETLAREVLEMRGSGIRVRAIRDVLRWAVAQRVVNSDEAREIDQAMRMKGYKGPQLFLIK